MPSRHVIFLNGPIGAGKTVFGRLAAVALGASFIDSDDLGDPSKRWFEQGLSTSRVLVEVAVTALRDRLVVVVARPLRARDWAFFKRRFEAQGVVVHCITLAASADSILGPDRGREFDAEERARIAEMIAQGYASRRFSDAIIETDRTSVAETAATVVAHCRRLLARQCGG
jgi:hypothetical protein